jgi:hypothetical protein
MRIFLSTERELTIRRVAGEMFNLEAGIQFYDNGALLPEASRKSYPRYVDQYKMSVIRAPFGLLVLPPDHHNLLGAVLSELASITESRRQENRFGRYHLNWTATLESESEHFTALRAKGQLDPDDVEGFKFRNVINIADEPTIRPKLLARARFTWFVTDLDEFVADFENYGQHVINPYWQLVGIMYDAPGIFRFLDNSFISEQISWRDIRSLAKFRDVVPWGEATGDRIAQIESWIQENIKAGSPKRIAVREIIDFYYKKCILHNFILSGHSHTCGMVLCPVRRGAFEFIRHLGKWEIFENIISSGDPPLVNLSTYEIYEVDYKRVVIDSEAQDPDRCFNCGTPLYDDFYAVYSSRQSSVGRAICAVCLHSKFGRDGAGRRCCLANGSLLFQIGEIVARVKHPRTAGDLISELPVDDFVRYILRLLFQSDPVFESAAPFRALGFGSTKDPIIAWSGPLSVYATNFALPNNRQHQDFFKKISDSPGEIPVFIANVLNPF